MQLFITVLWVGLQCVIVLFPDHTHLFLMPTYYDHFNRFATFTIMRPCQGMHRGSYMSAHVLLNLLNELRKRDQMRGLPSILSFFRNKFYQFNTTGARMLDSIKHMILRLH